MLLDSNIIIYAARPDASRFQDYIESHDAYVSAISYVEVLGFPRLNDAERRWFTAFFESVEWIHVSRPILDEAIRL